MKKFRSLALAGVFAVVAVRVDAQTITENFSSDPLLNGWQVFGRADLFQWTNQSVAVTWDSTNQNSYLYKPLGTVLTKDDDFSIEFDLRLDDAVAFNYGAPIAVGLFRLNEATNVNFSRGGGNSPDLFEFDFFPDTGFGDSIDATLKDSQGGYAGFYFAYDNLPLDPAFVYHVALTHVAGTTTISGLIQTNGQPYTTLPFSYNGFPTNFQLDAVSVSSYQDDGFGDSVRAHGMVDNLAVTLPPPVRHLAGGLVAGLWQARAGTYVGWTYTLQRTTDFQAWTDVSVPLAGTGGEIVLSDTNPPAANAFYRVKAEQP